MEGNKLEKNKFNLFLKIGSITMIIGIVIIFAVIGSKFFFKDEPIQASNEIEAIKVTESPMPSFTPLPTVEPCPYPDSDLSSYNKNTHKYTLEDGTIVDAVDFTAKPCLSSYFDFMKFEQTATRRMTDNKTTDIYDNQELEDLFNQVNNYRITHNLNSLTRNKLLDNSACDKLKDMSDKKYFEHTSPDGISYVRFFLHQFYNYKYAGENLIATHNYSSEEALQDWKNSKTHNDNLLNSIWKEVGYCIGNASIPTTEGNYSSFVVIVQHFGLENN